MKKIITVAWQEQLEEFLAAHNSHSDKKYFRFDDLTTDVKDEVIAGFIKDQSRSLAAEGLAPKNYPKQEVLNNVRHGAFTKEGGHIASFWDAKRKI